MHHRVVFDPMEGLESVYAEALYGGQSDMMWGGNEDQLIPPNLSSCFMSNPGAPSMDPSSLDCLLSASNNTSTEEGDEGISVLFSDSQTPWSFGGVSSAAEPDNREHKSLKRQRGADKTGSHFRLVHPQNDADKGSFKLIYDEKSKKPRASSNISFQHSTSEPDAGAIAQMKEMIYRAAAFRPVNFGLETVEKPKRKNVRISTDPQTVAARQRRERISEKIRVLQTLVPGGTKMDTASMLDEAANYLKFLRAQVKALENLRPKLDPTALSFSSAYPLTFGPLQNPNHHPQS